MTILLQLPDPDRTTTPASQLRQSLLNALITAMQHYSLDDVATAMAAFSGDITHVREEIARRQLELAADLARRANIIPLSRAA
jgi:hypothetical protein